jgi:RNA polymerase sigma-70 factor (ECF subfamily)
MSSHSHTGDCKEVFALLSQWLDLELPPDSCQEIEKHLAGCPPCIEFAESLRKTVALCRQYQETEVPAPLGDEAKRELLGAYQKMLAARSGRPR